MKNKSWSFTIIPLLIIQFLSCKTNIQQTINTTGKQRPNVIVIMTDDQGYGDIAVHGNPFIETPNMDELHDKAVRLENFHVAPTCSPTRAQLMTGKYNHRVGVWHTVLGLDRVRKTELTMADAFSQNGYATGIFGKWHLGDDYPYRPSDRGFKKSVIHKGGSVSQMSDFWDNDRMNDTYFDNNQPKKYSGFCTDVFYEEAMSFMKANSEKPFFAYIPTSTPHGPNNVLQKWANKYLDKGLSENVSNFYASIERVDYNLGKLKHFLKESGLEKNTILVFLTDNGTTMPNNHNSAGMRGNKGSAFEGGHRVPCFIYWPGKGFVNNKEYKELTSVMDLLPTFIDVCNLKIDENIKFDGISLKPLLFEKKATQGNRFLLVEEQRIPKPVKWKNCVMINENWRLINGKELYNLEKDFAQKNDVAKQHPEIVELLRSKYENIWDDISTKDTIYNRLILGASNNQETILTALDWYWANNSDKQNLVVGQSDVRTPKISNGHWPVEIEQDGEYNFELRRWPKESGLALNATTPEILSGNNDIELKEYGQKPQGKRIEITKAKLKINDIEKEVLVNPSEESVTFSVDLKKGHADIQTWFYTTTGDNLGAYYVYARRKNSRKS